MLPAPNRIAGNKANSVCSGPTKTGMTANVGNVRRNVVMNGTETRRQSRQRYGGDACQNSKLW